MTAVANDENVPPGCVDSLAEIIFRRRSTGSPIGAKVASYPETLQKQVLTERKNEKFVQQMQVLAIRRKQSTVRGFANLLGEDVRSEAVVNHAMINRTPLTPQAFDPVFLWDRRIESSRRTVRRRIRGRARCSSRRAGGRSRLGRLGQPRPQRSRLRRDGSLRRGLVRRPVGFNMLMKLDHLLFDRITSSIVTF